MSSDLPTWQAFDAMSPALPPGIEAPLAAAEAGPLAVFAATPAAEADDWAPRAVVVLASHSSRRGRRVLLADLGLENPRLHEVLGQENVEGVVDACLYGASLRRIATAVPGRAFLFAAAGTYTPDPESVVRHERWDALIRALIAAHAVMFAYVPVTLPGFKAFAERGSRVILLTHRYEDSGLQGLGSAVDKVAAALGPPAETAAVAMPHEDSWWPDIAALDAPVTERHTLGGERGGSPWNIVLAEDEENHALLIRMALERASRRRVELTWVREGDAALRAVEAAPPDLMLLDLHMPGRSGHEVLGQLKTDERLRPVPVAVLTTSDRDEDIARSYGLGANHFITKSGDVAEMERRLRRLLDQLPELRPARRGPSQIAATAAAPALRYRQGSLKVWRSELVWAVLVAAAAAGLVYAVLAGR
ncbi:MAG: response regulator [Gemmatimonadetes bacterium]|nr:response regulator [Gemmatimonadota bacterium]